LRLVGVAPLTPAQAAARTEEWEMVRDAAPAGLLGPAQLTLRADAPLEEHFVVDAYYARTRTAAGDLRWLLRGLAALASPRAWLPRRDQ
jgi:lipopolysaccharide/colanic/teichoic acid biosynthesis glycosyltransferase